MAALVAWSLPSSGRVAEGREGSAAHEKTAPHHPARSTMRDTDSVAPYSGSPASSAMAISIERVFHFHKAAAAARGRVLPDVPGNMRRWGRLLVPPPF